jgi:hypothetical protein
MMNEDASERFNLSNGKSGSTAQFGMSIDNSSRLNNIGLFHMKNQNSIDKGMMMSVMDPKIAQGV